MPDHPTLVNKDRALQLASEVQDPVSREAIRLMIEGTAQFFLEQPSQLASPFDLAFFAVVLKDRIEFAHAFFSGTGDGLKWFDDEDVYPAPTPVLDPAADAFPDGIRIRQAYNYLATRESNRLKDVLLTVTGGVHTSQSKTVKRAGYRFTSIDPEFPFDWLFMAMAIDYALRPGQRLRDLFETPKPPAAPN